MSAPEAVGTGPSPDPADGADSADRSGVAPGPVAPRSAAGGRPRRPVRRWMRQWQNLLVPLDVAVARTLLHYGAVLSVVGGLVLGLGLYESAHWLRLSMALVGLVLGGAFVWAGRQTAPRRVGLAMLLTMMATVLAMLFVAWRSGLGVHSVTLGLVALVIAMTGAMIGSQAGLLLAAIAALGVLGLWWDGRQSAHPLAALLAPWGQQRLLANLFTVLCGAGGAFLLGTVLRGNLNERRRRERMYRGLFSRSASALVLHRDWRVIEANEAAARLFGFVQGADMAGIDLRRFYSEADVRRAEQRMAWLRTQAPGQALEPAEFTLHDLQDRRLLVTTTAAMVSLADGPAIEVLYMDMGGLRQAERLLLRSEAMLSRLFAAHPDGVALTDAASGQFVLVNPAFELMSGYSSRRLTDPAIAPPALWGSDAAALPPQARLLPGQDVEGVPATLQASDGRKVAVRVSAAAFTLEGRTLQVITCRDVSASERTRLEYEATLQAALIGIAYTRDGRFVHSNRRCEDMFGWGPGELEGQPGRAFWASDEEYAEIGNSYGPLLSHGQPVDAERLMTRRDGSRFLCRLRAQAIDPSHPSQGGTIWLFEDVTEQRRTREALASARDAAEAASRAKSAFLANMSHEIRTPLNALIGLARLAQREDLAAARRHDYLRQMLDSAEALSDLVSDTLDLAKIEAGRFTLDPQSFSLHALLRVARAAWQSLADARGLQFEMTLSPDLPDGVQGDPARLRQILGNYMANALKFTERGSVALHARVTADGFLRFEVRDTGPGISPDLQARLFQPFMQADASTTRRHGGTGLGLSICRELAHLMGGQVGVDSTPGQGSVFWVSLPLPAALPGELSTEGAAGTADDPGLQGLRVLVAEDNDVNMLITVALLEQWGVATEQARDGADAVRRVEAAAEAGRPFDLVLMDVHMPVMDGHEAARRLRQRFAPADLAVVALTASVLVSEREQALAAGMDAVLAKPVQALALQAVARRCAAHRQPAISAPSPPR